MYYVLDADYTRYLDIQQTINLELLKRFTAEHIEFAFPTRTIMLEGSGGGDGRMPPPAQRIERIQPPSTAMD